MNDEKKNDDQFKVAVDRRTLLLNILVLAGVAVLLAVGLTPRRTADDTAETAADRASLLSAGCQVIQHITYEPCGHELTRRVVLPEELIGKGRTELEAAYDLWRVTGFASDEVSMELQLPLYCAEHTILMADESGMLCIWKNRYGDALALEEELKIPLSDFPEDVQDALRGGMGFESRELLDKWLENAES